MEVYLENGLVNNELGGSVGMGSWEWDHAINCNWCRVHWFLTSTHTHSHTYMHMHTHTHTHTHHAQVIEETLRMHCPVRGPFKEAPVGGVTLSGYSVPGGTMIFVSPKISMLVHVCMFVCM